jgi:hypothetical protein
MDSTSRATPIEPIRYDLVPPHMRDSIREHIENGRPTGDFLTALLSNDLMSAVRHADDVNRSWLRGWTDWLLRYAPLGSYGSAANVTRWKRHRGLDGYSDYWQGQADASENKSMKEAATAIYRLGYGERRQRMDVDA